MRYVSRIVTKLQSITTHCSLHRSFTRVIPDLIRDLSLVVSQNKIPAFPTLGFAGMTKMKIRGKCPTAKKRGIFSKYQVSRH